MTRLRKYINFTNAVLSVIIFSMPAWAQKVTTNEYWTTLVISQPVSDKVILLHYSDYSSSPDNTVKTKFYSQPGVIHKPTPWLELWAGLSGIYNDMSNSNNSLELRPSRELGCTCRLKRSATSTTSDVTSTSRVTRTTKRQRCRDIAMVSQ